MKNLTVTLPTGCGISVNLVSRVRYLVLVPLIAMLFFAGNLTPARAAAITWTGATDNAWTTATNWSGGILPGTSDIATFDSANLAVDLSSSQTLYGLTFGAGATGTVKITLTTSGKITLNGGSTSATDDDIYVAAGNHEIVGRNSAAGDLSLQGSTSTGFVSQRWNIATGASLTFTDVHMRSGNAAQTYRKIGGGTVVLAGDSIGTSNAWALSLFTVAEGTLKVANKNGTGKTTNAFTILSGATLDLAANYTAVDGNLTISGDGYNGVGAIYNSTNNNSMADGTGALVMAADSSIGVASGTTLTISQDITGTGRKLTKIGTGTLVLGNANAYSGGTAITAGTLRVANNGALGTGAVAVNSGVMAIDSGNTVTNNFVLSGGQVQRSIAAAGSYTLGTSGTVQSNFATSTPDTIAQVLASSSATAATTFNYSFSGTSSAMNDGIRQSDVFSMNGIGTDIIVLQLQASGGSMLGWLNGSGIWVNASDAVTSLGGQAISNFSGTFASSGATATADYLGSWGYDATSGSVWAVVNKGGDFTVIPEPGTWALLLGGLILMTSAKSVRLWKRFGASV